MNIQFADALDQIGFFRKLTDSMIVEPTKDTPFVKYSRADKLFMVKGDSTREGVHHFYEPFISRVKAHLDERLDLNIILCYNMINPTTAKVLFDLFKFLRLKKQTGIEVNITWCAEASNHEMYETGEDFAELYDLDIKFLTI